MSTSLPAVSEPGARCSAPGPSPTRAGRSSTRSTALDAKAFHALIDPWELFAGVPCIDVAETVTHVALTGDKQSVEVCEIRQWIRPPRPRADTGRGYRLADGSVLWLSEADWWAMMDRAVQDVAWRDANQALLVAVGMLECHLEVLPTVIRFDTTNTYRICPPTRDPHERRR